MGAHLLTARQAEIWEMSRKQGMTVTQIARRLKIKPQSVDVTLKGALRKLTPEEKGAPLELASPAERLASKSEELERAVAAPGDQTAIRLLEHRIIEALVMLDRQRLAEAGARELTGVITGLTNVKQLLNDKPTSITRFEDMRKLDEFLESVSEELRRRGEGPEVIDVTPEEEKE